MEIVTEPILSLFSFAADTDAKTSALLEAINADERIYLTQTKFQGRLVIRFQAGAWHMDETDVKAAIEVINEFSDKYV